MAELTESECIDPVMGPVNNQAIMAMITIGASQIAQISRIKSIDINGDKTTVIFTMYDGSRFKVTPKIEVL